MYIKFDRKSGIYLIFNKTNKKIYIGQAVKVGRRITNHISSLNNKTKIKTNTELQKDWNKLGQENFIFDVLEWCEESLLSEREKYYIKKYKSNIEKFGYNKTTGGQGGNGFKWTDEQRRNNSGINHHNFGKPMSIEQREKLSKTRLERKIGVGKDNWLFGKHLSEEHRKKVSENHADVNGINNGRFGTKDKRSKSRYFGVRWSKSRNRWIAMIIINRKQKHIKSCKIEEDAARERDKYVVENNLPHPLNFPEEYNR